MSPFFVYKNRHNINIRDEAVNGYAYISVLNFKG